MLFARDTRGAGLFKRVEYAFMALCVLVGSSGCGSQWLPTKLKVDVGAVYEVRSIGKPIAQTKSELQYEGAVQIVDILVLDLGKTSFQEALNSAHDSLRQHGWADTGIRPDVIHMNSAKWGKANLAMGPLERLESYNVSRKPEIVKALKGNTSKVNTYLVVDLSQVD